MANIKKFMKARPAQKAKLLSSIEKKEVDYGLVPHLFRSYAIKERTNSLEKYTKSTNGKKTNNQTSADGKWPGASSELQSLFYPLHFSLNLFWSKFHCI